MKKRSLSILVLFLVSCGAPKVLEKTENSSSPSIAAGGPGDSKPVESTPSAQEEVFGPPTPQKEPSAVAVLLTGQGVKSYAGVGVLRLLEQEHLSVAAVVGVEWGSLIAGIYCLDNSVNALEWKLLKIKDQAFFPEKNFLTRVSGGASGRKFYEELEKTFSEKRFNEGKIRCRVGAVREGTQQLRWFDQEKVAIAVQASMTDRALFQPVTIDGAKFHLGTRSIDEMAKAVREWSGLPVVVVAEGETTNSSDGIFFLGLDLKRIDATDFQKKQSAIFEGKKAAKKSLGLIRKGVGIVE